MLQAVRQAASGTESCVLDGLREGHQPKNKWSTSSSCHTDGWATSQRRKLWIVFICVTMDVNKKRGRRWKQQKWQWWWQHCCPWGLDSSRPWGCQFQFLPVWGKRLQQVAFPAWMSCVMIVWVRGLAGKMKDKDNELLAGLIEAHGTYRLLNHFFTHTILASLMNTRFWTSKWCCFNWNIRLQLNSYQLQISLKEVTSTQLLM